ncbi:COG1361 S-layer family protein [Halorarius litoreus]|uniref:COG1361 S-layer family protein n=1 Tax=Halorarius litoreus TaxID=2962676 RepID=UPI0020CEC860|nr:CARDB domain-containing protein [Halorarius litoreus]
MDSHRVVRVARRLAVAALVLVLVVPTAALGVGVSGAPDLSLYATNNELTPGETTALQVSVVNSGDVEFGSLQNPALTQEVTTAQGTTLKMRSGDAPVDIETGTVALGSVPRGSIPATFQVSVDENAKPGTYRLPVRVEYSYTSSINDNGAFFENQDFLELSVKIEITEASRFEVVSVDTDAAVGESGQVAVTLRNDGDATAEDATVSLASTSSDLSFGPTGTAETFVGDWEAGETKTVSVGASVARDATVRALPLSASVSWTDGGQPASDSQQAGVVPNPESTVTAVGTSATAAPGDSGEVTVELTNNRDRTLRDATVQLASSNGALTFGGAPTASTYVGTWEPGETKTVSVEAAFQPGVEQRSYPVDATVSYTGPDGRDASTRTITLGVVPADEQSFDVTDVEPNLRVGAEGSIEGTLVNEGPDDVENAVLVLQPTGENVNAVETEYALGDLAPDASTEFSFDLDVSTAARDGPRQFSWVVEYAGDDGSTVTSDPLYARAEIQPQRDVFDVEVTDGAFTAGSSGQFTLEVTNAGDETLTDISAKLFADSPVSVSDDEAFVDSLEPGESTTLQFGVSVAGSATPKTYPVSVDFQYAEPDGDTKLSDSYRLPVTVEPSEGGGLLFVNGGGLAGAGLGLGVAALALVAIGGVIRFR